MTPRLPAFGLLICACAAWASPSTNESAPEASLQHDPFQKPGLSNPAVTPPAPQETSPGAPPKADLSVAEGLPRLSMTLRAGSNSAAYLDGRTVRLGEQINGYTLIAVHERAVTLRKSGKTVELKLDDAHEP